MMPTTRGTVIADDDVRVGVPLPSLGPHTRRCRVWLPRSRAARPVGAGRQKKLTNQSTTDCTRYPRPCALTVSYFGEQPRIHSDNDLANTMARKSAGAWRAST